MRSPQDPRPIDSAPTFDELAAAVCARHGGIVARVFAPGPVRLYARIRAEVGLTAIQRGVASDAEHLGFSRRSPSDTSHTIGRLR